MILQLFKPEDQTPIFNSVLKDVPVKTYVILPPTKRQKHRAGKLTGQVWAMLSTNAEADTSGLSVEDTQEIPLVGEIIERVTVAGVPDQQVPRQRMNVETMVTGIGVA